MSDRRVSINELYLDAVGDAIRYANGSENTYTPAQFEAAIKALKKVLVSKVITENGDYDPADDDADGYSGVTVNVSGGGGGGTLITKTITQNGTYNASSDNADGYSIVTVNVSGGGVQGLYAGTDTPSDSYGSDGDVYLKYATIGTTDEEHVYVIVIQEALRGSSSLTYAGATEIDLIFDDGNDNDVSIKSLSGFSYSAYNGNGTSVVANYAFDGNTGTYFETNPTPITINMTATVPVGYTPKTLKVMQRSSSFTQDVWKTFYLADTMPGMQAVVDMVRKSDLSVSDWAGAYNYTDFTCGPGLSGIVISAQYVKESGHWTEKTNAVAMRAILDLII